MADAPQDPLVSCAWLAERLDAPDIRILDATLFLPTEKRDAKALYEERRIPGAIFFDIEEISDSDNPLPHMLPAPEKFASRMKKLGVGDGARVVVYDNKGLFSAARVWWHFRVMGHDDVVVLDGGFPAWEAGGYPIETGAPQSRMERHFTPRVRSDLVRDIADVRSAIETKRTQILDARPKERFEGTAAEPRAGMRSGHMPGATNVPLAALLQNGVMRSREELAQVFAERGVATDAPIVCSCGSGVTAAVIALAIARLGRWDAPIYDGSWSEWGSREDTPVVTGA